MLNKVREYIEENGLLDKGENVVLGVSGGADSTALFEVLTRIKNEYGISLFVVHVDHGIRKEAGQDAAYVRKMCGEKDIPFYLFSEDIPKVARDEHISEEEAGRRIRYGCFKKVMKEVGASKLAVAHHLDDQVETVLFHLARGTDIAGAGGMRPKSPMNISSETEEFKDDLYIIRPLLNVRRKEIEEWLAGLNVGWQEDVTNKDVRYARNRIRNLVIPELNNVNEKASEHIFQFAKRALEYDEYIGKQAAFCMAQNIVYDAGTCSLAKEHLLEQDRIIAERIIYEMLVYVSGRKKDITGEHVKDIYELIDKQSGSMIYLPYNVRARISYERLILDSRQLDMPLKTNIKISVEDIEKKGEISVNLPGGESIKFSILENNSYVDDKKILYGRAENLQKNYTKYFDCDTIENTLYIRNPEQGDYLICDKNGHRKKLSKFFKDIKLPGDERRDALLLAASSEILCVLGDRRCETHYVDDRTEKVLKVEYIR